METNLSWTGEIAVVGEPDLHAFRQASNELCKFRFARWEAGKAGPVYGLTP